MRPSSIVFTCVISLSLQYCSVACAQHGDSGIQVPAHPKPVRVADSSDSKVRELIENHLMDYEVWVVDRDSLNMQYKLHLLDGWGWSTHQTPEEYAWYSSDTLFDSREQAIKTFEDLQRRFGGYLGFAV